LQCSPKDESNPKNHTYIPLKYINLENKKLTTCLSYTPVRDQVNRWLKILRTKMYKLYYML